MDLKAFPSIDAMSVPLGYCRGEFTKGPFEFYEFKVMAKTTFAGVARRQGLQPGEEWKVLAATNRKDPEEYGGGDG